MPPRPAYAIGAILFSICSAIAGSADSSRYRPVSREIIENRLQQYAGTDQQRENTLKHIFADAGCAGQQVSEQPVKDSKLPNLICILPGTSSRVIIVGAHFDHISAGDGVVDNWSGASLLPSLYEAVKVQPRTHTYIFIAFTDEEKGLVGSHFYAHQMTKEQIALTDAMVNMDTLGLAPTEVWTSHSDKVLVGALGYVAKQLHVEVVGEDVEGVGSTDSVQFSDRKIPSITVHSLTQKTYDAGILHSPKDKLSAMNLDQYYETYRLLSAYLTFLDHFLAN